MLEKKSLPDWRIALNQFLATGFTSGIFLMIAGLLAFTLGDSNKETPIATVLVYFVLLLSFWLGIKYGSRFVATRFIIKNHKKIAIIVLVYFLIIFVVPSLKGGVDTVGLLRLVALSVVYYVLNVRYLNPSHSVIQL